MANVERREPSPPEASRGKFFLAAAVVCGLALLPILVSRILPFGDYPNHLARFHILSRYSEEEWMQAFWRVAWEPLPNLGVDLMAMLFAKVLPIVEAGRAAVAVIVLLHGAGFAWLHREWSGRLSIWALLGFPLAYTFPLFMGFLNYQLGIGLLLCGVALHLRIRNRSFVQYAVAMVPLACLVMLAHLMTFVQLLIVIALLEIGFGRYREREPLSLGAAIGRLIVMMPLPMIYYFLGSGTGELGGLSGEFNTWTKLPTALRFLSQGIITFDFAVALALALLLIVAWRSGWRFPKSGLFVTIGLVIVYALSPEGLRTTHFLDARQPALILTIALALIVGEKITDVASGGIVKIGRAVGAFVMVFVLVRLGAVTIVSKRRASGLDAVSSALAKVPDGSLLFFTVGEARSVVPLREWNPPLLHAASLGAVEHRLYPVQLFTFKGQQPLTLRPELTGLFTKDIIVIPDFPERGVDKIDAFRRPAPPEWRDRAAYVLFAHGSTSPSSSTGPGIVEVAGGERWTLYRLPALPNVPVAARPSPPGG